MEENKEGVVTFVNTLQTSYPKFSITNKSSEFEEKINSIEKEENRIKDDIIYLKDKHVEMVKRTNEIEAEAAHGFNINIIMNVIEAIVIVLLGVLYFSCK